MTDISQSTEYFLVISAKPELKLGQHLVDGRIVSINTVSAGYVCLCACSPTRA